MSSVRVIVIAPLRKFVVQEAVRVRILVSLRSIRRVSGEEGALFTTGSILDASRAMAAM